MTTAEAPVDLAAFFDDPQFDRAALAGVRGVALANQASFDRFREHVQALEKRAAAGGGSSGAAELKLGACWEVVGDAERAASWLERAGPTAERDFRLGAAYRQLRRFEQAAECFTRAARAGWDRLDCECARAEALAAMGRTDEARAILDPVAEAGSGSAAWQFARGRALEADGDLEGAIACHERALDLDPDHGDAMFHLAYLADLRGNDEAAMQLYKKCAQGTPARVNALINLAVLHEDAGDYEQAADCLLRVLDIHPNHARAQLFLKDVMASDDMYVDEQATRVQEMQDAVLDIPVTDFELSVRSRNCLKKMNIGTLGDLLRTTERELLAYKNFGETSLNEIKVMLTQKGLTLGQYAEASPGPETPEVPAVEAGASQEVLGRSVSTLELSVRARKCLQRLNLNTIGELLNTTPAQLLASRNFGQTSLSEITGRLAELGLSLRSA